MDVTIQLMGLYMSGIAILGLALIMPLFFSLLGDYLEGQVPPTSQRWVAVIALGWFKLYLGREVVYAYAHA